MIICIEVNEADYKNMNGDEKMRLLREGYARSKQMQLQAKNYKQRLELLNIPRNKADAILTEKQEKILLAYECGLLT